MIGVFAADGDDPCAPVDTCFKVDIKETQGEILQFQDTVREVRVTKTYEEKDADGNDIVQPEDATSCQKPVAAETIAFYPDQGGKCKNGQELAVKVPEGDNTITKKAIYTIDKKASEWKWEDNVCFVSGKELVQPSPSLAFCYKTRTACCNYLEDAAVGGRYEGFVPGPCIGDFKELQIFSCLGCNQDTNEYVLKAEASEKYVTTVSALQGHQAPLTGIHRSMEEDIANGRAKNGYIKICSHWL